MNTGDIEQAENLRRVRTRIGDYVLEFVRQRGLGEFHAADLVEHVWKYDRTIAPASPDRVLRALKAEGNHGFDYRVKDRRASLYEITENQLL